jgi:hypothetical protein
LGSLLGEITEEITLSHPQSMSGRTGLTMSDMWFDILGALFIIGGSAVGIWIGTRTSKW